MDNIIDFFLKNKDKVADFMDKINVSREKTVIKFGAKADHNISITCCVYGDLIKEEISYEDKVVRLFNSTEEITILNELISEIDLPYHFSFSPFLKISKENEPLIHAFQIVILFEK
jgi:hypothetical protein